MVGNLLLSYMEQYIFYINFFFLYIKEREGGNDDDGNAVYISVLEGDKRKIWYRWHIYVCGESDGFRYNVKATLSMEKQGGNCV